MTTTTYRTSPEYAPAVERRCWRVAVALGRCLVAIVLGLMLGAALSGCAGTGAKTTAAVVPITIDPDHRYELYVHVLHDHPALVEWIAANATGGYNFLKTKALPTTNPVTP